jgi:hypothetical protein
VVQTASGGSLGCYEDTRDAGGMVKAIIMVLTFIAALILAPDAASTEVVGYF